METAKKRRPFGFYVCSMGFTFERLAFYTVKYLLAIWIATDVAAGGLGLSDSEGVALSANFVAMTYITPIIGGYIADYWLSPKLCVAVGMILMGIGYLCTWQAHSLGLVWAMIILVSIGTGLFKGNLSGVNGLLFHDKEELDAAFSIQYSFVNIGSFVGTTFIAILATTGLFGIKCSFNTVFLICAIFLFIDAAWFILNGKSLGEAGKKPFKHDQREFVSAEKKAKAEAAPLTSGDKKKIAVIVLITIFSVVFWALWYMTYMPAYYRFGYGDGSDFMNKANWYIGSFQIPTSWFDSINALTCIILGPVLAGVWAKLANRPQGDMSMYQKTGLGMILLGISYVVMVVADMVAGDGQCSIIFLLLVCVLMSVGEMVFSPLGNSFISKLAPAKVLGLLLGFWPIAVFFSNKIYPPVYDYLKTVNFAVGYGALAAIVIVFGVVLWAISGKLEKMETEE
ncbi:MAG: peptide MFS transporter [Dorea sp.]|uniref:peptide MFS transporter n=1 Tax=Sporofaciens musculi TaxID=2681861 RepID=UPI00216D9D0D|nr:peptide MFS transporter [Sporofaciens musculi]MCI9421476.1 peptide MFS transporter [Dorea sp.]